MSLGTAAHLHTYACKPANKLRVASNCNYQGNGHLLYLANRPVARGKLLWRLLQQCPVQQGDAGSIKGRGWPLVAWPCELKAHHLGQQRQGSVATAQGHFVVSLHTRCALPMCATVGHRTECLPLCVQNQKCERHAAKRPHLRSKLIRVPYVGAVIGTLGARVDYINKLVLCHPCMRRNRTQDRGKGTQNRGPVKTTGHNRRAGICSSSATQQPL